MLVRPDVLTAARSTAPLDACLLQGDLAALGPENCTCTTGERRSRAGLSSDLDDARVHAWASLHRRTSVPVQAVQHAL